VCVCLDVDIDGLGSLKVGGQLLSEYRNARHVSEVAIGPEEEDTKNDKAVVNGLSDPTSIETGIATLN